MKHLLVFAMWTMLAGVIIIPVSRAIAMGRDK